MKTETAMKPVRSGTMPVEKSGTPERNIQAYLEGHVYHGRTGRKMDNG
jgi:hypothetical protein